MACPIDARYYGANEDFFAKLKPYVSEDAYIQYQVQVEVVLAEVLAEKKIAPPQLPAEIQRALKKFTVGDVYEEEERIGHVVRALVNCIRDRISEDCRPFVHLFATSNDITDTATALRLKALTTDVILPSLLELQRVLIDLASRNVGTVQIGRTHGKWAEPITFGYFLTNYIARLGNRIEFLETARRNVRGKLSGAVGAYNALALVVEEDPLRVESAVLERLGLRPSDAQVATQIVHPEYLTDLVHAIVSTFSVLANLADDIRHLHRSEIGETQEIYDEARVGSSTMPHKLNPKNFEFVKSMWKEFMPRMVTVYMDQISEHQRDLTNSASSRFVTELFTGFAYSVDRLAAAMTNLHVDSDRMKQNLLATRGEILAEPIYILLSSLGHPDGHTYARKLVAESRSTGKSLTELIWQQPELKKYLDRFTPKQLRVLERPEEYIGAAMERTEATIKTWRDRIGVLEQNLARERKSAQRHLLRSR